MKLNLVHKNITTAINIACLLPPNINIYYLFIHKKEKKNGFIIMRESKMKNDTLPNYL